MIIQIRKMNEFSNRKEAKSENDLAKINIIAESVH